MPTKTPTTVYTLELTKDEALALAMLPLSGISTDGGFVAKQLVAIGHALRTADPALMTKQYDKWAEIGCPHFKLLDTGAAP